MIEHQFVLLVALVFIAHVNGYHYYHGSGNTHNTENQYSGFGSFSPDFTCGCWNGCEVPEESNSVDVSLSSTSVGSVATYVCKEGYENLVGSKHIVCQDNGTWTDSVPSCTLKNCGAPDVGDGTEVSLSGQSVVGNVATYTCLPGYENLSGRNQRHCLSDGTWSGSPPTCNEQYCFEPDVESGTAVSFAGIGLGYVATYSCASGYRNLTGSRKRVCQIDGTWSSSAPTCTEIECEQPDANPSSTVTAPSLEIGALATYECDFFSLVLLGNQTRTCLIDGTWSGTAPTCVPNTCGIPADNDSVFFEAGGSSIGSVATYQCRPNYVNITGDVERICLPTLVWSGSPPTCSPIAP